MVDFLFIVVAIFAVVAVSRKALYDSDVTLIKQETPETSSVSFSASNTVNLSISSSGHYKWLSESHQQEFDTIETFKEEVLAQMAAGKLSASPHQNQILLHIDQGAQWNSIANLIFSMHEEGFVVYPIYEKKEKKPFIIKN